MVGCFATVLLRRVRFKVGHCVVGIDSGRRNLYTLTCCLCATVSCLARLLLLCFAQCRELNFRISPT